jgi:hypothetical protein
VTVRCPEISEVAIIADDARLGYGPERAPYVMTGVFPQRLRVSRINAPQYIMRELAGGLVEWRRMLATAPSEGNRKAALESHVQYYERELAGYRQRWLPPTR